MRERALRDREQQLQAVLDMSRAGILMTNANRWTISYANKRMAELFECPLSELDGTAFLDYVHPAETESAKLDMHMMVTGLDGLKQVNDTHGHEAGDALIRSAAKILNCAFRSEDLVARTGGDEFVVLLLEADEQKSCSLQKRSREAEMRLNSESGAVQVRISMGSATAYLPSEVDTLISQSDKRMYEDKSSYKQSGNVLSSYCSAAAFRPDKSASLLLDF